MKYILTIIIFCLFLNINAQDTTRIVPTKTKQTKPLKEKLYYGGNVGLSFGSYTMIGIYPLVGYKITPKLSTGVKIAYEYISDKRYASTYNTSNYGGSIFARYRIAKPVYLHIEYAGLNYEIYNPLGESKREWIPFFFVGGGYSQPIGKNIWLNAQVLFDVIQSSKSPYNDWEPFFSIGISAGF